LTQRLANVVLGCGEFARFAAHIPLIAFMWLNQLAFGSFPRHTGPPF
jgi:hypothetical protein